MGWRGEGRMVLESLEGSLLVFGHEFALLLLLVTLRAALTVLAPFSSNYSDKVQSKNLHNTVFLLVNRHCVIC